MLMEVLRFESRDPKSSCENVTGEGACRSSCEGDEAGDWKVIDLVPVICSNSC